MLLWVTQSRGQNWVKPWLNKLHNFLRRVETFSYQPSNLNDENQSNSASEPSIKKKGLQTLLAMHLSWLNIACFQWLYLARKFSCVLLLNLTAGEPGTQIKWTFKLQKNHNYSVSSILEHQVYARYFMCLFLLLLSHFSRVRLCATQWTAAHQAPPFLGFSRQEHWSGLPFPSPMHEVKSESEVAQLRLTLRDPMDCSLPGSSVHGIFQARVLEWGAIAFSVVSATCT